MDFSKLKVADLKRELKSRGLNTSGTKNDLMERLQEAAQDEEVGDSSTIENDDLLDEDAVLADESEEAILDDENGLTIVEDDTALLSPTSLTAPKLPISLNSPKSDVNTSKKVVLNRNIAAAVPIVKPQAEPIKTSSDNGSKESGEVEVTEEKKIVKLGALSLEERAKLRAQKFGVPVPDVVKKSVRAERFGVTSNNTSEKKTEDVDEKLLKRQARFGVVTASEVDAKKQKRAERFGNSKATVSNPANDELKRKRAERFGIV